MLDKLFYNGCFYTMEQEGERLAALGVKDGKIAGLYPYGVTLPQAKEKIDLAGGYVLPGFIDSHLHLMNAIQAKSGSIQISRVINGVLEPHDLAGVGALLQQEAPAGEGILVGNHYIIAAIAEARLPNRYELDRWLPGRKVAIYSMDLHSGSYSTPMLESLGLLESCPDGILTGADFEFNQGKVADQIAQTRGAADFARGVAAFCNEAAAYGVTCLCALDGNEDSPDDAPTLALAACAGQFPLAVRLFVQYTDIERAALFLPYMSDKRLGGCGAWEMDGSIGSRSAAFQTPYRNQAGHCGELYYSYEQCRKMVATALAADYQLTVHAIGTEAIEEILSVYEELLLPNGNSKRHRIDHLEFPTAAQVARVAKLGLIVTAQPGYTWFDSRYQKSYAQFLEPEIIARQIPLRDLQEAGVIICGGSDCPVQEINPFLQIQGMVDFPLPEQSLTMYQAIATYTKNGAYALHEEKIRGTLALGKVADFMVLPQDPFACPIPQVHTLKPCATYLAGEPYLPLSGDLAQWQQYTACKKRNLI